MLQFLKNQLKCVFKGHIIYHDEIKKLNESEWLDSDKVDDHLYDMDEPIKVLESKCGRCNYPLIIVKTKSKPDKYRIYED